MVKLAKRYKSDFFAPPPKKGEEKNYQSIYNQRNKKVKDLYYDKLITSDIEYFVFVTFLGIGKVPLPLTSTFHYPFDILLLERICML